MNTKILYDEVDLDIDPFDPENRFILSTEPLVGTLALASTKVEIRIR